MEVYEHIATSVGINITTSGCVQFQEAISEISVAKIEIENRWPLYLELAYLIWFLPLWLLWLMTQEVWEVKSTQFKNLFVPSSKLSEMSHLLTS